MSSGQSWHFFCPYVLNSKLKWSGLKTNKILWCFDLGGSETKSECGALWIFFGIPIEIESCLDQLTLDTYTSIVWLLHCYYYQCIGLINLATYIKLKRHFLLQKNFVWWWNGNRQKKCGILEVYKCQFKRSFFHPEKVAVCCKTVKMVNYKDCIEKSCVTEIVSLKGRQYL